MENKEFPSPNYQVSLRHSSGVEIEAHVVDHDCHPPQGYGHLHEAAGGGMSRVPASVLSGMAERQGRRYPV